MGRVRTLTLGTRKVRFGKERTFGVMLDNFRYHHEAAICGAGLAGGLGHIAVIRRLSPTSRAARPASR